MMQHSLFRWLFLLMFCAAPASAAVILQYHHVSDQTPRTTSVTAAEFKAQMQHLKDQNFKVVPLDRLIGQLQRGEALADDEVAITFDDGFANVFTTARPILKAFGFPYTMFLSPALIDQQQGPVLSWQQVKTMQQEGVIIANHSSYHHRLAVPNPAETKAQWRARVKADILLAEQQLEQQLGVKRKWLAYPYGDFSAELEQLVNELGFIGIGQQSGAVGPGVSLTRIPRYPSSSQFAALQHFMPKLKTLALPVTDYSKADPVSSVNPPTLQLSVDTKDFAADRLQCFFNGKAIPIRIIAQQGQSLTFSTQATAPLKLQHNRYNCTAPSRQKKGYFYWFSQPWVFSA
jgi:peptidoglycan/xylan/chitin deacetylase (PgdA/CDA1 family)